MIRFIFLLWSILNVQLILAQGDLVPNSSFEINSGCPTGSSQLYLATGWVNPTGASPDYYHTCNSSLFGIPNNWEGEQAAHNGNAYAGMIVFVNGGREYIQIKLADTLNIGRTYCIQYFVSLSGRSDFATPAPQMFLSANPISSSTLQYLPYSPQISNSNIIYDTTNWILISNEYTASGNEQYITIGDFYDDPNTPLDTIGNHINPVAYFYVDDVSIYEKINTNAGNPNSICKGDSVNIGTANTDSGIVYQWSPSIGLSNTTISNPWAKPDSTTTYILTISDPSGLYCLGSSSDSITITVNDCTPPPSFSIPTILKDNEIFNIISLPANTKLELFDSRGRLVFKEENYQNNFSVNHLAAGIYVYQLSFSDGTIQKGKFCVVQ